MIVVNGFLNRGMFYSLPDGYDQRPHLQMGYIVNVCHVGFVALPCYTEVAWGDFTAMGT